MDEAHPCAAFIIPELCSLSDSELLASVLVVLLDKHGLCWFLALIFQWLAMFYISLF